MAEPRRLRLTDLLPLLTLKRWSGDNEAITWRNLGRGMDNPDFLGALLRAWTPWKGEDRLLVEMDRQWLRGLAAARRRAGATAWEVELLVVPERREKTYVGLLEGLAREVGEGGAQRLFLRLPADSDALAPARAAGFLPYGGEWLLTRRARAPQPPGHPREFRKAERRDTFGLFRLYNRALPPAARAAEGLTLEEWAASREPFDGEGAAHWVAERDGRLLAWLRVAVGEVGSLVALVVDPEEAGRGVELVGAALGLVEGGRPLLCLVPTHDQALLRALEEAHFRREVEYVLLVKRTAVALRELASQPAVTRALPSL